MERENRVGGPYTVENVELILQKRGGKDSPAQIDHLDFRPILGQISKRLKTLSSTIHGYSL